MMSLASAARRSRATTMCPNSSAPELSLTVLPDDGPTGGFFSWDGTPVPW
jgi:hypothetical protein